MYVCMYIYNIHINCHNIYIYVEHHIFIYIYIYYNIILTLNHKGRLEFIPIKSLGSTTNSSSRRQKGCCRDKFCRPCSCWSNCRLMSKHRGKWGDSTINWGSKRTSIGVSGDFMDTQVGINHLSRNLMGFNRNSLRFNHQQLQIS